MPKHMLRPPGQYPRASLARRLAACFYDFLLSVALMMVITLVYQQAVLRLVYGSEQLLAMSQAGALDRDPLLASLVLLGLFAFYAKFWTHNGQTLGMQAWGLRIQNTDGTAIDLWQALLRFVVSIASWLCVGLGFIWSLFDKHKRSWHDIYSDTQLVRIPKQKK